MTGFPRQQARTRRFTLGVPRGFTTGVGPDGPVVLFLRTDSGSDPVTHLWRLDPRTGATTKLVDARELAGEGDGDDALPAAERARRERAREQAGGIVAYATDERLAVAAFALGGQLYTVDVRSGTVAAQPAAGQVFDPRPSPDGTRVAYHAADGLAVVDLSDGPGRPGTTRQLVDEPGVSWGRAEFAAAEEMGRSRGFWWAGDGGRLAVARVDERRVPAWTISDPARPWEPAREHRYPAAGTTNADVALFVVDARTGERTEVAWDRAAAEYLTHVTWGPGPLTLAVAPRDQRTLHVLVADPDTGATTPVRSWEDRAWVELVPGAPRWAGETLLTVEDRPELGPDGSRALCADGRPVTPAGMQVREVVAVDGRQVALLASTDDPTQVHVHLVELGDPGGPARCWSPTEQLPGVHRIVAPIGADQGSDGGAHPAWVLVRATLEEPLPTVTVVDRSALAGSGPSGRDVEVVAERPVVTARPRLVELGSRRLRAALFLPDGAGSGPLPVVLDPYGGPHAQRVLRAHTAHVTSQWLADQGYAVLVVDGRGSPGRGPVWERAIHHDLAGPVLEDQIDALTAAAALEPRLDLGRVAIRGWSFGGYLAALAVLRRPDVFRAAIAGAPVTDWRLYDTHYTERYLGDPADEPAAYDRSSLVAADGTLCGAAPWDPDDPPALLVIHGLADDNVVAAHALRLSAALLADGRPHRFLPLSGVTHMTPQEVVAERLLTLQAAFLREVFGPSQAARERS